MTQKPESGPSIGRAPCSSHPLGTGLALALLSGGCMQGQADGSSDVGAHRESILNGQVVSSSWSAAQIDVGLFLDGDQTCSGTLLRNNVVLTAGHCFQEDFDGNQECYQSPTGCPAADLGPEDFTVHQTRDLDADNRFDGVAGAYAQSPVADVAMFRTEKPFSVRGSSLGHSTQIWNGFPTDHSGGQHHSAWGFRTCTISPTGLRTYSDNGTQSRQLGTTVQDFDHGRNDRFLHFTPGSSTHDNTIQAWGDSGSSYRDQSSSWWNEEITGVASYMGAPSGQCATDAWAVQSDSFAGWAHNTLAQSGWSRSGGLSLSGGTRFETDGSHGSWSYSGGELTQTSNRKGIGYVNPHFAYSDADITVEARAGDNDYSGIVFRYRDDCNFYFFEVSEQSGTARIGEFRNCSKSTLQQTSYNLDWNSWHTLRVVTHGSFINARIDGQSILAVSDNTLSAGTAGVWTQWQQNAKFRNMSVTAI